MSRLGLCVLGLLCLHSSVFGQDTVEVQPGVLIFCDDPSVQKAIVSALHKFNEGMNTGHKLALFQILSASKSENGSDSVYSLQFTSRRSDCPAGSAKSWTDCDYLPLNRDPISCNATVYMTENEADTRQVDCVPDDYIVPEKAYCLGCPEEIDENSEDLKGPLVASISKYNSMSNSSHLFTLHTLGHATRQVVAGFRFKLRFDMRKSTCAKAEHNDLNELCVPDEQVEEFAKCNSTVDVAPWRLEPPQAHIECEPGALPTVFIKRRPPGWSPLRNLLYDRPAAAADASPASSTNPPNKEESSEEDTTASKPSTSPVEATDSVSDSPFHCPSKSWKPFNPVGPEAPTEVTTEEASPQPPADGTFSDTDLVG